MLYAALQLALLVLAITGPDRASPITIAAASLSLFDAVLFVGLSALEHSRSRRSSLLFSAYLFFTLLFDAIRSRTLWLSDPSSAFSKVFTAAVGAKVLVLLLESQGKRRWLSAEPLSPERTSGLFSFTLLFWMTGLVAGGFRNVLAAKDLYVLDETLTAEAHRSAFRRNWRRAGRKHRLVRTAWSTLKWHFLVPVIPRLALGTFDFSQAFLIQSILNWLQQPQDERSRNVGYGFIGAAVLVYVGLAVSSGLYRYLSTRSLSMLRACLVTAIYETTTTLPSYGNDNAAAVTLMNTDVTRIRGSLRDAHECWANVVEVAIACYLLERQLGAAFVAPLVVVVLCAGASLTLGRFTGPRMEAVMKGVQRRVGLTANVIENMTSIRMSGLARAVEALVQRYREDELGARRRFLRLIFITAGIAFTPLLISPIAAFGFTNQRLTITRTFTALAYIQLLCTPLTGLLQTIPQLMATLACVDRIDKFLLSNKFAETPSPEEEQGFSDISAPDEDVFDIAIRGGVFGWEAGKPALRGINVRIPHSKLTTVIGPVGSGKTTLCKALLSELPYSDGEIKLPAKPRVSYCDQTPFLVNGTLKVNILGFDSAAAVFDKAWYEQVLFAAALAEDIETFPNGDESIIGTNGITLSGGQRQRSGRGPRPIFSPTSGRLR